MVGFTVRYRGMVLIANQATENGASSIKYERAPELLLEVYDSHTGKYMKRAVFGVAI